VGVHVGIIYTEKNTKKRNAKSATMMIAVMNMTMIIDKLDYRVLGAQAASKTVPF
jgi:Lhr-like helicase